MEHLQQEFAAERLRHVVDGYRPLTFHDSLQIVNDGRDDDCRPR
jgi:hypothetical protein